MTNNKVLPLSILGVGCHQYAHGFEFYHFFVGGIKETVATMNFYVKVMIR